MITYKNLLGAFFLAFAASSPAWAHAGQQDVSHHQSPYRSAKVQKSCLAVVHTLSRAVKCRNNGMSPQQTYKRLKDSQPIPLRKMFKSKEKENNYLKRLVNKAYFNKKLKEYSSYQVTQALSSNCIKKGQKHWKKLKPH